MQMKSRCGAPKSVHLAVVSGEESGDEGVGGESGPNGDEVVKELPLKRFEFGAVEPGPGDRAEQGEAKNACRFDHVLSVLSV